MGSRARVVVYAAEEPIAAVREAFAVIDRCDLALSDYNPNSEARRLADAEPGAWHEASELLVGALVLARLAHDASGGDFDVTIGPVTELWRRANAEGRTPTPGELAGARARVSMAFVEIDEPGGRVRLARPAMRLDFGALGKGYAADLALASLRRHGVPVALVEIGGDLAAGDPPPGTPGWSVRIDAPGLEPRTLTLTRQAAATSGDAYRFTEIDGVRASHIIEPATAEPVPAGAAITVLAREAWLADAAATVARLRGRSAAENMGRRLGGVRVIRARE